MLSEISRNNANSSPLPQNHWKTGKPSGNFNMTKYDENITKVLTYIYGDDLSLNQSDFENPDWRLKVIGPNDKNSNWTFIHSMYSRGYHTFSTKIYWLIKFVEYLRTLSLKFRKAVTKIEVVLTLPCWLFQLNWDSLQGRARTTSILLVAFWNSKLKVLKYIPQKL